MPESSNVADLTLERVRRLETELGNTRADLQSVKTDTRALIDMMAARRAEESAMFHLLAKMSDQLTQLVSRTERIERRLDIGEE